MKRLLIIAFLATMLLSQAMPALAQDKVEFASYFIVYAVKGPNWKPQTDVDAMDIRLEIIENLKTLLQENNDLIIAGLVNDGSDAEFVMIFQTEDEMGLRDKLKNAKNVKNGFFKAEGHSFHAPAGLKLETIPRK